MASALEPAMAVLARGAAAGDKDAPRSALLLLFFILERSTDKKSLPQQLTGPHNPSVSGKMAAAGCIESIASLLPAAAHGEDIRTLSVATSTLALMLSFDPPV